MSHPKVQHAHEVVVTRRENRREAHPLLYKNEKVLEWITDHILGSVILFDLALLIPLLAIPAPDWIKFIVIIVSSNWIQLWALPALQRSQNRLQRRQEAKADVDHRALTHIAKKVDQIYVLVKGSAA